MPAPLRLAIIDDHRMLLAALSEWVRSSAEDVEVVAAVASWQDLLAHPGFPVDVALLDLDLRDGLPVAVKLRALHTAGVAVVVMSTYSEPAIVRDALASGALGYLLKSEDAGTIVEAVRTAAAGGSFLSPRLTAALEASTASALVLSDQERRVMALYGSGRSVKQVASALHVSSETVRSHLKRIRDKHRRAGIDVSSKMALRARALSEGLLADD
ncbi:response regulator transcription factor [Cnuibacter physcomitrellae]|uniref:response regulator transcription factor n=1 Tax=Cnuibacter physcomitrellae TaxID=1619308 RepID=UPI0021757248|nr:response regulator transcription factor [Cnuibacter physcomitrellae]MCS5499286.1 response regulator transcription factor [Cnuibacter physcomitrellae]